jgi:hypothetical protein
MFALFPARMAQLAALLIAAQGSPYTLAVLCSCLLMLLVMLENADHIVHCELE